MKAPKVTFFKKYLIFLKKEKVKMNESETCPACGEADLINGFCPYCGYPH